MNKILLLIFISFSLSCTSQEETNYADKLADCLTKNDLKVLNEATSLFEEKLEEHYKRKNSNKNFKAYIEDLGSIPPNYDFSPDFYANDKTVEIIKK